MSAKFNMRQRVEISREQPNKKNSLPTTNSLKGHLQQAPSTTAAFLLILAARLLAAFFSNISDCDETFNYWEPLHKLTHGHGFQTWEYSPTYAIRSYAYISSMLGPLYFIKAFVTEDKISQFFLLRIFLAVISSAIEAFFYRGVKKGHGQHISRHLLLFLLFSPGLFISSTAFLPSSFSMLACTLAYASWWCCRSLLAPILMVGCASFYGWPFAAIIGVPLSIEIGFNDRKLKSFVILSTISFFILLLPLTIFDSYFYGKLSIPPINILIYNVFSGHGPNLYGTESWTFYFINCFLNFNVAFVLALLSFILFVFIELPKTRINQITAHPIFSPLLIMALWMLVFFTRPHKEERFIFPIYPFIALCAAWSFECIKILLSRLFSKLGLSQSHSLTLTSIYSRSLSLLFIIISLSRIFALYYGYHGSMKAYRAFPAAVYRDDHHNPPPNQTSVCVGKEWYRFPSHFFLPQKYHLKFLRSEFSGQLPGEFSSAWNATRLLPSNMNDLNLEQPERYVNISTCDFLVDLDTPHDTPLEPRYSQDTASWRVLVSEPFLDPSRSSSLFRAFYIPFISNKYTHYAKYNILARKET